MKKFFLFFVYSLFVLTSCEDDDAQRPINPLPDELSDAGWVVQASRPVGQESWREFNYVSIWAGREYYSMDQGDDSHSEGSFNWYVEGGVQKLKLQSNDRNFDLEFDVVRYDCHHMIARLDWGGSYEEWIFYNRQENLGGLVVDQRTSEPLQNAYLYVQSDDRKLGLLRTDEYGYFGLERYDFDGSGNGEVNRLYIANEGYEDRSEYISYGQFYLFDLRTGESGLNYATITGHVTDEETGEGIANVEISFGSAESVLTDYSGRYEIAVPISETELIASAENYDSVSEALVLEGLQSYIVDFALPLSGVSLGGGINVIGGGSAIGAEMTLTDENQHEAGSMVVDANGDFSLDGVPDGLYVVSPSLGGMQFVPAQQFVQVSGSDVTEVHFFAMADGQTGIGGQITQWEDDDTPIEGVTVTIGEQSFTTAANGYFLMELSTTGSLSLKGEKQGLIDRYKEVNVYDGNLIREDLRMASFEEGVPLTVTGNISSGGQPIQGAIVKVPNNQETTSDVNGDYSLTITVYDELINQWVELICEKAGYATDSVFLGFYPEIPATHDFWLMEE